MTSAYLELMLDTDSLGCAVNVNAEVGDSQPFQMIAFDVSNRPVSTAEVEWTMPKMSKS